MEKYKERGIMNLSKVSTDIGKCRNWLYVIRYNSIDKFNALLGSDTDPVKSIHKYEYHYESLLLKLQDIRYMYKSTAAFYRWVISTGLYKEPRHFGPTSTNFVNSLFAQPNILSRKYNFLLVVEKLVSLHTKEQI